MRWTPMAMWSTQPESRSSNTFLLCTVAVLLMPAVARAAPAPSAVDGALSNGSAITVSGSGFGSVGPEVVIFDDFESGTDGAELATGPGSATVGAWMSYED